jgi:hypothetical protein
MTAPHSHWKTNAVIKGLRYSGIVTPLVIDRVVDHNVFETWVDQVLFP